MAKNTAFINSLDTDKRNLEIRESIQESIENQFPIQGKIKTLVLKGLTIEDKTRGGDFPTQKEAKLNGKSWENSITANLDLVDNVTGIVVDSSKIKIGAIPTMTNRFSMIIDGSEYQTQNQFRLKSGVYTRKKENGQLESRFNLEKGYNFKLDLDPEKGVFYFTLANKHHSLYALLKALGVSDTEMRKRWGTKVFEVNQSAGLGKEHKVITEVYETLTRNKEPFDKALEGLREYLDETKVSPKTTKVTLGKSYDRVSPEALLTTSDKLLKVMKGEEKSDERDSLVFKDLYGVDDLVTTYFDKSTDKIVRSLAMKADLKNKIRDFVDSSTYGKPIKTFFTTGDLSATSPQTNPVEMLNDWRKTTVMGTGGITSRHAITDEARDLHPSHIGFLDPVATPESFKVGVTLPLAIGVEKDGKDMYTPLVKNGAAADPKKPETYTKNFSPADMWDLKVGFPDEYTITSGKIKAKNKTVRGYYKGKASEFKASEVDYFIFSPSFLFSFTSNMVPFLPNTQGNRAGMGSRMLTQAVSLVDREIPLVQTGTELGSTYENIASEFLQPTGYTNGVVTKIDDDYIHITNTDGEKDKIGLYNYFPLNQNSFLHSDVKVKVGDKIKKDQVLADHTFSKDGTLALGANAKIAYMPWKGYNFEDGVVVTESFSKKFTSQVLLKKNIRLGKDGVTSKTQYRTHFPDRLSMENFGKLGKDGIIAEGTEVNPGDILISYMEPREQTSAESRLRKMNKVSYNPYGDKSLIYEGSHAGVVKYVRHNGRNVDIHILVKHPMEIGDKVSGRFGNKGIVTKIIQDDEAPHNAEGERFDIMMSPSGVPGRINPSQLLETAAGKWAQKTGNTYIVNNFRDKNSLEDIKKKLADANIDVNETLYDGKDGKPFENKIFTGNQYILRLMHDVEKKLKARDSGSYDQNMQPGQGKSGGQSADPMLTYSLIAHGAKANLKETSVLKGQQNDEIWRNLQLGLPLPTPKVNFAWDKMVAYLRNSGVNIEKKGNEFITGPFTDKQVKKISSGALDKNQAAGMLKGKNLAPIKGGLFDPELIGGMAGDKWAHIKLNMKTPHPVFEGAIQKITGISKPLYEQIMLEEYDEDGITGSALIEKKLKAINVDKEIAATKKELATAPKSRVNVLNKKIRHLNALKLGKMKPVEMMIENFPVMPSKYRPVYPLPSGDLRVSPINEYYKRTALIAKAVGDLKDDLGLDPEHGKSARIGLYESLKEGYGLVEPKFAQMKNKPGLIKTLAGSSPKEGFVQSVVWSKRQDVSARSTITVGPDLGLDEVGIPIEMAKVSFRPFVVQELVRHMGLSPINAKEEVKKDTQLARIALRRAMDKRPIMLNRAPSLHKHSVMAFKPIPVEGRDIKLNPLVVGGFNADFDGDTMSMHIPVTNKAIEEAQGMIPSKNVFKHGDFSVVPEISRDYQLGLFYLTKKGRDSKKKFPTTASAKSAGLGYTDVFDLAGKRKTTIGIESVNAVLPIRHRDYKNPFSSKKVESILDDLGKNDPGNFGKVITSLKDLGNKYGHIRGTSISIDDLYYDKKLKAAIIKSNTSKLTPGSSDDKIVKAYINAKKELSDAYKKVYTGKNKFYDWIESGGLSESKSDGINQMIGMPGILTNTKGNPIPIPVVQGYGEGLDSFPYFTSVYGVRKGTVDRAVNTQKSGALNKRLLASTRDLVIKEKDCGTKDGIDFPKESKNIMDRILSKSIPGLIQAGTLITPEIYKSIQKSAVETVWVRSPLTCETDSGVCQECYGLGPGGQFPSIGTNVGVLDGQAITERSTQLGMRTFHSGGAIGVGAGVTAGFDRLEQLFKVPQTISNKAVLAKKTGTVDSITPHLTGGYEAMISGTSHVIPSEVSPSIKKGQKVSKGDKISTGNLKPQELAELRGFKDAQRAIISELDDIYENKFFQKTFETAIRGVSDNATVTDSGDSDFIRGDKIKFSHLNAINKDLAEEGKSTIKYDRYFKSIDMGKDTDDWLDHLSNVHLKSAISDMASTNMSSNIHGTNPLPAYMYGLEFGEGDFY